MTETLPALVCSNMRVAMTAKEMDAAQLAGVIGEETSTVAHWLTGEVTINVDEISDVAEALGTARACPVAPPRLSSVPPAPVVPITDGGRCVHSLQNALSAAGAKLRAEARAVGFAGQEEYCGRYD
jgi:hypothetical protein